MVTTVGDFVTGDLLEVIGGDSVPLDARPVETVTPCGPGWRPLHGQAERRRFLAIVPAEQAPCDIASALRDLARQGAVAVSLSGNPAGLDLEKVQAAAEACDLVALASPGSLSTAQLLTMLTNRQNHAYRQRHEIAQELMRLTVQLHRQMAGPQRLLDYVQRQTGVRLDILTREEARWEEIRSQEPQLDLLADGAIAAKSYTASRPPIASDARGTRADAEWNVSLHALQGRVPHPVLVARAPGVLSAYTLDLVEHTAGLASMLDDREQRRAAAETDARNRVVVLQYLMKGEVDTAAVVAERMAPGLLSAGVGRVAIIECGLREDRAKVAEGVAKSVSPVVAAQCPAYDRHLIVALPTVGDEAALRDLLGPLAEGRAIGVSAIRPWSRTVLSYQNAFHALSTARAQPSRITIDDGNGELLAGLLPATARAWGRALYSRLASLPEQQRALTLHTAQIALAHGPTAAGKMVGVPRTTAGYRLTEVMGAMGLDRGSLVDRATAELALQLASFPQEPDGPAEEADCVGPVPALTDLLAEDGAARTWAKGFLAPLDEQLVDVLAVWLRHDGQIGAAADELGTSRTSVARRLDRASALLSRPLREPGAGAHDLLWALLLTGRLDARLLPGVAVDALT